MKKNNICPKCGEAATLIKEKKQEEFRKEKFEITEHYYYCDKCKEEYEPDYFIDLNLNQIYNQYREKYNILFPEQIKKIREQYKLIPTKMSRILGFGDNVYRSYENGEVPSLSNAMVLKSTIDPGKFENMVKEGYAIYKDDLFSRNEYEELLKIINKQKEDKEKEKDFADFIQDKFNRATSTSGYKIFNLNKYAYMVVYFLENYGNSFKTYINKFLFYSDFLNYKSTGYSISGSEYIAMQKGPVPDFFDIYYELMKQKDVFAVEEFENENGVFECMKKNMKFNPEYFNKEELDNLENSVKFFSDLKPISKIVDISHEEKAWKDNVGTKQKIDYQKYAFEMRELK